MMKNIPKPIYILPIFYFLILLYTILGTYASNFAVEMPFHLHQKVNDDSLIQAIISILISASTFIFGAWLASLGKNKNKKHISFIETINKKIVTIKSTYIIIIYLNMILFLHLGYTPSLLYYREGYNIGNNGIPTFRILYTLVLPFSILLLAFIQSNILRWVLLLIILFLVLGTSSRMTLLIPFFYYLGFVIKSKKNSLFNFFIFITSIVFLLNIVINFRDKALQGVIPNFLNLVNGNFNYDLLNYALNYIFSFSVFATAYTIQDYSFDLKSFYYSVTPLPSSYIDFSYMLSTQKFNQYAPFPAIAYLSLGGMKYLFFYYLISGFIWAYILKKIQTKNIYIYFLIVILLFLFTILSTQYNLRAITRLIYYSIFIYMMYKIKILLPKKKNIKPHQSKGIL